MRDLAEKAGYGNELYIKSSATSTWEIGNPVYPPARKELALHGIDCRGKKAELLRKDDYDKFDMFICMDSSNVRDAVEILGGDSESKVSLLLAHTGSDRDVADPWYTGDFATTYADVKSGCQAILKELFGD